MNTVVTAVSTAMLPPPHPPNNAVRYNPNLCKKKSLLICCFFYCLLLFIGIMKQLLIQNRQKLMHISRKTNFVYILMVNQT